MEKFYIMEKNQRDKEAVKIEKSGEILQEFKGVEKWRDSRKSGKKQLDQRQPDQRPANQKQENRRTTDQKPADQKPENREGAGWKRQPYM